MPKLAYVSELVEEVHAKTILNRHKRRDPWFLDEYSINPYGSCDFGCVYCYIHGGKYGSRKLVVKINAPELLSRELSRLARRGKYGIIALGSATEPWMHIDKRYQLTRKCLEIIARFRFPIHCLTKSTLILRDIDVLKDIDENAILPSDLKEKLNHGVLITFSFSTLDKRIAKIFEPFAPSPDERLNTIQRLKDEGFFVGIAFMPLLPYISDSTHDLEAMVKTARDIGVDYVFFGNLTLDMEGKKIFFRVLERNFPSLVRKYEKLYGNKNLPIRTYVDSLYRRAYAISRKHGVRIGIT